MQGSRRIPHFKYDLKNAASASFSCIEADGKIIHRIADAHEFYRAFGYKEDMARQGILPEEFIWAEYVKGRNASFSSCIQVHIIEYLNTHSATFRQMYGKQYASLLEQHARAREAGGLSCAACRVNLPCNMKQPAG